jgi:hypothetical protein
VNFFEHTFASISRGAFGLLDWMLIHIFSWHWIWFSCTAMFGVTCFAVGRRLKKYNNPDFPLASPAIRLFFGQAMHLAGFTANFLATVLMFLVVALVSIGASAEAELKKWDQWAAIQYYFLKIWPWIHSHSVATLAGAIAGAFLSAYLVFVVIPFRERGQGLRDVRHMSKLFKGMKGYSPQSFFDYKKGIFVGLEDGKHPIHVPIQQFHETHTQVIGASGSGKGIALGVLAYQFTCTGESVIIFDPKGDKRLPLVAALAAKKSGKRFWFIDLRPEAPPQFNLIGGANAHEIEELFVAGLGLQPTSGDGDYYRGIDQDAAATVAQQVVGSRQATIATALDLTRKDAEVLKAENFVRRLKQVSELSAIQTWHDFDFQGILDRGDVLYILGATDNHRVKTVQTMLLIRLLQIIKRQTSGRKIALFLDEFKHLLCPVSLDALGTVRELGCHAILAHQSMGDLGGCPGLKREDVEPRVVDNTTLKLVYRLNDAKASADFAARSGRQRTHAEGIRELDQDNKDQRAWSEVQQFRMSEDLFTHLHRPSDGKEVVAAGVLFGYQTARLIAVSPITVAGHLPPAQSAPAERISRTAQREAMI